MVPAALARGAEAIADRPGHGAIEANGPVGVRVGPLERCRSALSVAEPARPSTVRPAARWKEVSAVWVPVPNPPSKPPGR